MHHCLHIPEIFARICGQCDYSLPWERHLHAVVALARTCRAFYEPAIAHLWYDIDSLIPLVKCMPADLWAITTGFPRNLVFNRAVLPADWPRFVKHARHVRRLGYMFSSPFDLSVSAYERLHLAATGHVLLPHLKELYWNQGRADGALPFISLFMAPTLKTFHISTYNNLPALTSLIANLSPRYPFLTDVNISVGSDPDTIAVVSAAVCGWHQLRRLSVGSLTEDALRHVAMLPELHHLSLQNQKDEFPGTWNCPTFPALINPIVDCDDFSFYIALLRSMATGANLNRVFLRTQNAQRPGFGWEALCHALRDTCLLSSPNNLTIWDGSEPGDGSEVEDLGKDLMIKADHLRPLLNFANITEVDLHSRYGFNIDDTLIRDLARAWPHLKMLTIKGGPLQGRTPCMTIGSLRALAQHCKHLWLINVAFDARSVPIPKGTQRVYSARLSTLDVIRSPISNAAHVAAFLSDIFPRLSSVQNCERDMRDDDEPPASDMDKKWTEVESLVKVFALVRAQEASLRNLVQSDGN
ncbi:hypothetical protein Hypma_016418 [Hypsizygus marmoreus]|uniref:F-box domain-containing protein n=1 Tax=Hypsizygus marmoreus TaxID=39966 RepID=A0A369IZL0_HYPMA|nr:hypothetical protein Hypma_016418 [Hypsizygus marmoreus]